MCGVVGYWAIDDDPQLWREELPKATLALHRRGPDDQGVWFSPDHRIGFGHRRLSILDLSSVGHQPMVSACGDWVMVFNGEIYNYKDIRSELEALGDKFSGSGDSEVILSAFARWGVDATKKFIGMFAIALWQKSSGELHLIRDRLGVKPLYYLWNSNVIAFASELKALRSFSGWTPIVDQKGLADFFRYGYIGQPMTIYRDVYKVPPGARILVKPNAQMAELRYWNVTDSVGARRQRSEDELIEELEPLLESAFSYRMVSDVPVGVFLSGGIDSSLVTSILQKNATKSLQTFTVGFNEDGFNEAAHAEEVARHVGSKHTTEYLDSGDALKILSEWGDLYDEPFGDATGIPTLLISRVAAESVKVVLSADGGDELFAGYTSYEGIISKCRKINRVPKLLRSGLRLGLQGIPWESLDEKFAKNSWEKLKNIRNISTRQALKLKSAMTSNSEGWHFDQAIRIFGDFELTRLLPAHPIETRVSCDAFPGKLGERMGLWDVNHYMPDDILAKVDRATMWASIEGREPLIDHRLVEFAFSIDYAQKQGSLGSKHLLRKILYKHVPQVLVDRPKKGFSVPIKSWLSTELRGTVEHLLNPARILKQGLFDAEYVSSLVTRLRTNDESVVNMVWLLLAFQMWHERWME